MNGENELKEVDNEVEEGDIISLEFGFISGQVAKKLIRLLFREVKGMVF